MYIYFDVYIYNSLTEVASAYLKDYYSMYKGGALSTSPIGSPGLLRLVPPCSKIYQSPSKIQNIENLQVSMLQYP